MFFRELADSTHPEKAVISCVMQKRLLLGQPSLKSDKRVNHSIKNTLLSSLKISIYILFEKETTILENCALTTSTENPAYNSGPLR